MKIGILTHYDVNNQGAQLQMYALTKEVEKLGHEAKIMTYVKNYDFDNDKRLKYQPSIKSIPIYVKEYLIKRGFKSLLRNYKKLKLNKDFRKKNFVFENYATADIDMAIVGSDEVFSIPMGVNMMMYGHCVNTNKMVSYAPAFGQTNIELLEQRHSKTIVAEGLKNFVDLSARDEHTLRMIKELTNRDVTMVCDPAILHEFSKEEITTKVKKPKQKYLVIYAYDHNMSDEEEIAAIKKFAREKNLIIVSPGTYHRWCDKNIPCNALEWIDIIKNAEFVITDTFHGTIVASIMNVPMAVFVRNSLNKNKMTDLLNKLGITERRLNRINKECIDSVLNAKIDFEVINDNIKRLRAESLNYLKNSIEKCQ